jgi:ribosomal protein S19
MVLDVKGMIRLLTLFPVSRLMMYPETLRLKLMMWQRRRKILPVMMKMVVQLKNGRFDNLKMMRFLLGYMPLTS